MKLKMKTGLCAAIACTLALSSAVAFTGCTPSPAEKAKEVAVKALEASVDRPGTVKIRAVSEADSVFGRDYVSPDEKLAISVAMMKLNERIMKKTGGFENFDPDDKETSSLMERQMSAISALRSLLPGTPAERTKDNFTGWKVKIEYEAQSEDGRSYRSEYWFILDREAGCVVKSFEIPLP